LKKRGRRCFQLTMKRELRGEPRSVGGKGERVIIEKKKQSSEGAAGGGR